MNLNCKGTLINITTPKVMGILNITPDSFYDGGNLTNERLILAQAEKMLKQGATLLDIGGHSSRPGANEVSEKEELQRVVPAIEAILKQFPEALISIDTFRSEIVKKSVEAGAVMVNDISAGNLDSNMMKTVAQLKVPYVMMHMKGNPKTMVSLSEYKNVTKEVLFYFSEK